jgi:hypothetical protein
MARLLALTAVLAVVLVARPAVAAPQTDARSAARGFANATSKASKQLHPVRDEALAAPMIAALHACLDDWAARPERLTNEVFAFYEVVIAAPLWPVERPPQAQWVADLGRVRGVGALPSLRDARRTLKAQLAYVDALYAEPVDACAEVRAWRAADWKKRPPQVARILRLRTEAGRHAREWRAGLGGGGRFIRRLGGAVGRKVYEDVWMGIGRPYAIDTCDEVLLAVNPEEGFCDG